MKILSSRKNGSGQGLVEYALASAVFSLVVTGALLAFGPQIKAVFSETIGGVSSDVSVHDGVLIIDGFGNTPTPIASSTPIVFPTQTASLIPAATQTASLIPTATQTASLIPTATEIASLIPSATQTASPIPPTATEIASLIPTATQTASPIPTATQTASLIPTATQTASPIPTATPTATATAQWNACSKENKFCSFSGTAPVRFGAFGTWVTQTHTDGVSCTVAVFGDPLPGVKKQCEVYQ